jgi:CheY-like chemotaxis protein
MRSVRDDAVYLFCESGRNYSDPVRARTNCRRFRRYDHLNPHHPHVLTRGRSLRGNHPAETPIDGNADPLPLSVLVVDDFEDAAWSLVDMLVLYGCAARAVCCADEALQETLPDVVILELGLPGLDGWELVRRMRSRPCDKQPLYIAVTTCGLERDRHKSKEAGIDLHLVKPVEPAVLVGALKRLVASKK